MGAAEEMELDLKLGEEKAKRRRIEEENYMLRKKLGAVRTVIQQMITDPKNTMHAKMQAAAALDALRENLPS